MFNAELFSSSTRKYAAVLIPLWLILAVPVFAQSDLRDAVYGKPKSSTKTKTKTPPAKSKTTKTITPAKPTAVATVKPASRSTTQTKKTPKTLIPVIFRAKEASVEVWLNDKIVGQTDSSFQFSKKIAPGEYSLVAKNKRQVLFSKKIIINPEQTRFDLFDREPPVLQVVEAKADAEQPKEKTEAEIAKEDSEKVKKIIETYEAPATTDSVTTDDWQFVLQSQSANQGLYQGNTLVQIEAQRWFASGQIELAKRDYTNAFTAFRKASDALPTWAFPYYETGNTHLANNQPLEAIKLYQIALQKNNKLGMVYKKLGDAQRLLNKDKEALSAYESAIQFGYRTFDTRYQTALLRIENKQIEKGIEELKALAEETPKVELFMKIGEAYEKLKQSFSAIEFYQKAIALDPNLTQAHYRIGGLFFNIKEYPKAKESLEKAIALDPVGKVLDIKEAQKKLREISTKGNR